MSVFILIASILLVISFPVGYIALRKRMKGKIDTASLKPEKKESEFPVVQALKDHGWIITLMEGQRRI